MFVFNHCKSTCTTYQASVPQLKCILEMVNIVKLDGKERWAPLDEDLVTPCEKPPTFLAIQDRMHSDEGPRTPTVPEAGRAPAVTPTRSMAEIKNFFALRKSGSVSNKRKLDEERCHQENSHGH